MNKKPMKKSHFLLLVIVGFVLIFFPNMREVFEKMQFKKQELTVTKVLSHDELYWIERNQRELANKILDKDWLAKEIREGAVKLRFNLDFMEDHPEYDLIEIRLPTTRYKNKDNVIEFISDEGVVSKVHSENGLGKIKIGKLFAQKIDSIHKY